MDNNCVCDKCNGKLNLIKMEEEYPLRKSMLLCSSCNNLKLRVESMDEDGIPISNMQEMLENIDKRVEYIEKEEIPKRRYRELNCFNNGFEKGIEEIGVFYISEKPEGFSFNIGIERSFQNAFKKNYDKIVDILKNIDLKEELKEQLSEDLFKYRGLNDLKLTRFGFRKKTSTIVVDINKAMFKENCAEEALKKIQQRITPIVELILN